MVLKRLITDLPAELRRQIFSEYFKVEGGYAYNAESEKLRNAADNTPIDFSLMHTCRSIADDCKELPFVANTIHFSTVYREDWRSLAACYSVAANFYRVLQEAITLHLAQLITPEIFQQLEGEFPTFKAKLEEARKKHFLFWHDGEHPKVQHTTCGFPKEFFRKEIWDPCQSIMLDHRGFSHLDRMFTRWRINPEFSIRGKEYPQFYNFVYNRWDDTASGEFFRCLPQLLVLIADQNPKEFADRVYLHLPHWRDRYPAEDFLNMKLGLEWWAIPSWPQLSSFLDRLGAPDNLWKRPNLWYYYYEFMFELDALGKDLSHDQLENLPIDFDLRFREKPRFSAAAVAIRFIGLLPSRQRKQLRTISLYEDLPAVNLSYLHGHGLVPLLKENNALKIQRRVSIVDCVINIYPPVVSAQLFVEGDLEMYGVAESFVPMLSCWLLEALSVEKAGGSSNSFSMLLDSGPDADFCTQAFEELVHCSFARARAWKDCLEAGLVHYDWPEEIQSLTRSYAYSSEAGFEEAVMQLVNHSSAVLRCNFNPGLPQGHQKILDNIKGGFTTPNNLASYFWWQRGGLGRVDVPKHLKDVERAARVLEIQSGDEYLQSQGRVVSPVRSVNEIVERLREENAY